MFSNIKDSTNILGAHIPFIIEQERGGERGYDLYSRMLKDRVIYINGTLTDDYATSICTQMMLLERQNPETDIHLYINSPGGSVYGGLAILDTMNMITPKVCTSVFGCAASMGAFLLAAGQQGKRSATENATIMIHQPIMSGFFNHQATDMDITNREMQRLKKLLNRRLAEFTGNDLDKIEHDVERDYFMTAEEALEYGLIDEIVKKAKR